jgi:hypothetical protein
MSESVLLARKSEKYAAEAIISPCVDTRMAKSLKSPPPILKISAIMKADKTIRQFSTNVILLLLIESGIARIEM